MSFINSPLFWASVAAAGVAVPVLVHLFSRYRSRIVDWGAMELLRKALVVRAQRVRMEDLLLLAVRCLAVGLLAFALARPVLRDGGWIGESRVGVVIAVDSSFSMAHDAGGGSRFADAIRRAREIVASCGSGDVLTLVQLAGRTVPRLEAARIGDARIDEVLASMEPLPERLDLEACLPELARLADDMDAPRRECYVITDAQAAQWSDTSEGSVAAARDLATRADLVIVPVGDVAADNLAVTGLSLASGVLRKGGVARYAVEVRNYGNAPATDVPVTLQAGDRPAARQVIGRIEPGQTAVASLLVEFSGAGPVPLDAAVGGEAFLPIDNVRRGIADVREGLDVLCVEPAPVAEQLRNATGYLYGAFVGKADPARGPAAVSWTTIDTRSLDAAALRKRDVVFVADVPDLGRDQAEALGEFVAAGGGLVFCVGERTDAAAINSHFHDRDGRSLLAARLGAAVGAADAATTTTDAAGWTLAADVADHPATRCLAALPPALLREVRVQRYVRLEPLSGTRVLLSLENGDPLIVEREVGRGRVILWATSANRGWTNFPINPAFVMLAQQLVTHVTGRGTDSTALVGERLAFRVPEAAIVTGPDGRELPVERTADRQGQPEAVVVPREPGVLTVSEAGSTVGLAAVNVDDGESDVTVMRGRGLRAAAATLGARMIDVEDDIRGSAERRRGGRELWRWALVALLGLLVAESLLAGWFGRSAAESAGGRGRSGGVAPSGAAAT